MRAAVFYGAGQKLVIEEVPTPVPTDGELLIKIAACGVCHTDLHYIDHGVPTFKKPPLILGHEASGIVAEIGEGVKGWEMGDRVLIPAVISCGNCEFCQSERENICLNQIMFGNNVDGAYAEYIVAPAKDLLHLPESLNLKKSSIIADAVSTPYHAVKNRGQVRQGDKVVVIGCGGVGINVVQIAAAMGAKVYAVDLSDSKLELAKSLGAYKTVNPLEDEEYVRNLKKETGGGFEIAFEAIGNPKTISHGYSLLKKGGRLVVIGYTAEEMIFSPARLMYYELEMIGSLGCRPVDYLPLIEMIEQGKIKIEPLITGEYPLDKINEALDELRNGKSLRSIIVP